MTHIAHNIYPYNLISGVLVWVDISMPCDQWFQTGGNAINIFRLQDEEARLPNPKKLGNLKNGLL